MNGAMDWMSKTEPAVKWRRKFARRLMHYTRFSNKRLPQKELAIRIIQVCKSSKRGVRRLSAKRTKLGESANSVVESEEESETKKVPTLLDAPELRENPVETEPKAVKDEILYSLLLDDAGDRAWGKDLVSRMYNELPVTEL